MLVKDLIEKIQELEDKCEEKMPKFVTTDWRIGYQQATNEILCMLYDIRDQMVQDEFSADDLIDILSSKETVTIELDARDILGELLSND